MLFRTLFRGFKTTRFFKSYFALGILSLSAVFFFYFNQVTNRLERETAEFSTMLAAFAAKLPSVSDKETSDAGRTIIENYRFPFVVTDAAGRPKIARGIGDGLREKILDGTLTSEDERRIAELVAKMDKNYSPLPMQAIIGEEGRTIIGYFYYDQTKWSLDRESSFVITGVAREPVFWRNIGGSELPSAGAASPPPEAVSFVEKSEAGGRYVTVQHNPPYEKVFFHYGGTSLIHHLRWWMPLAQMTVVAIFLVIGFLGYQRIKHDEQQAIWAGLAKETAHQLGTPISSLMGWLEILEERGGDPELGSIGKEMQGDVQRLRNITARFGEVGSVPRREPLNVSDIIHSAVIYFQKRLPHRQKHIEIVENFQSVPPVEANKNLLQWVIENLIRNSLDAIERDDGRISIRTEFDDKKKDVVIIYSDNGKGITRKDRSRVFLPGYSTKKHGWGLGLPIAKRIIESYHGGRVKIAESRSEGATFVITLPAKVDSS